MKDIRSKVKSPKDEILTEKEGTQRGNRNKSVEAAFAAAISSGTVPNNYGDELFTILSKIGNNFFLKILNRKELINRSFQEYLNNETLSRDKVGILKERLSGDFGQDVNEIELMPEMNNYQPLPDLIGEENSCFSKLSPVSFDQGIIE